MKTILAFLLLVGSCLAQQVMPAMGSTFQGAAAGPPTHTRVKSTYSQGTLGDGTVTLTNAFSGGVSSGDLLIAYSTVTGSGQTNVLTDTAGFSWSKINAAADTNGCFYGTNSTVSICARYTIASSTVAESVTVTHTVAKNTSLAIVEYHWSSGSPSLDVETVREAFYGSGPISSGATGSVTGAGELIIGWGTENANDHYTTAGGSIDTIDANEPDPTYLGFGYKLVGASGAANASLNGSGVGGGYYLMAVAAFKP